MRVFDMPRDRSESGRPWRIAVIGSRRILAAFDNLASLGKLVTVWSNDAADPLTLGEAHQTLRYNLQEQDLPEPLFPFIFDRPDDVKPRSAMTRRLLESADAFVIEVSESRQIRCGEYYFQRNAFLRRFVTPQKASMPWYQALETGRMTEEIVESTIGALGHNNPADCNQATQILQNTRLEKVSESDARTLIASMRFKPSAKWIFVSPCVVRGLDGTLMDDRRELIDTLSRATKACGVLMFDPTDLATLHAREMTPSSAPMLYSYEPELRAAVGEAILSLIERSEVPAANSEDRTRPVGIGPIPTKVAERINELLIELHGRRIAELGEDESGLYAHYHRLLKLGSLIKPHDVQIGTLVTQHLPDFARCHVLNAELGEIAFVLAALGRDVAAFESNPTRLRAIAAGAVCLAEHGIVPKGRLKCERGALPTFNTEIEGPGRTLAILAGFFLGASEAQQDHALSQLVLYDALLYHPQALLRTENPEASEKFLDRLRAHGFSVVREFPHAKLVYCAKQEAPQPISTLELSSATNSIEEAARTLNAALLTLHQGRLARLGPNDSGLYAHYVTLLERGEIVRTRDAEIANAVLRSLPRFDQCHVLKSGLGELAFLLAGFGQPTVAFEANGNRARAIGEAAEHLARDGFLVATKLETAKGAMPAAGSADALAIATQLVSVQSAGEEKEILSRLSGYGAVLIDPARFLRERKTEADQEAGIDQLRALGFSAMQRLPRLRLVYCAKAASSGEIPGRASGLSDGIEWDNVRPLVFQRLSLVWDDIKLDQPYAFQWQPNNKNRWALRSFSLPGSPVPQDLTMVQVHPDGLIFPGYGAYYVTGPFGAAKILLIDPSSDDDSRIIAMSEFVARAVYHSGADTHLDYEGTSRYPSYPTALTRKLFYSDQPLALWCGNIADVLAFLLHWSGYTCRKLTLKNTNNVGHVFLEVYFPTSRRWLMVDPDFGVMLKYDGKFLSADDVVRLRAAGKTQEIQLVELTNKCFSVVEVNFPTSFTGQFTWKPSYLVNKRISAQPHYHDVVIARGFMEVVYYAYKFGHAVTTRIRPTIENGEALTIAEVETEIPVPK